MCYFLGVTNNLLAPHTTGERVQRLAILHGFTQTHVGKVLGLTSGAISQKYRNKIAWTIHDLVTLANLFDVSVDYLLGREEAQR